MNKEATKLGLEEAMKKLEEVQDCNCAPQFRGTMLWVPDHENILRLSPIARVLFYGAYLIIFRAP